MLNTDLSPSKYCPSILTSSKFLEHAPLSYLEYVYTLQLDEYINPTLNFSQDGKNLLVSSLNGKYSLSDLSEYSLLTEGVFYEPIFSNTFLNNGFCALGTRDRIAIQDYDGVELHSLDFSRIYKNCVFLGYSSAHCLLQTFNAKGTLSYFDLSSGKSIFDIGANVNPLELSFSNSEGALTIDDVFKESSALNNTVDSYNGVMCVGNCSGVFKERGLGEKSNARRNGMVSFFSPKAKSSLAEIQATPKGKIKALSTTSTSLLNFRKTSGEGFLDSIFPEEKSSSSGNDLSGLLCVFDSRNDLRFFDIRNYFKPIKKLSLPHRSNTLNGQGLEKASVLCEVAGMRLEGNLLLINDSSAAEIYRLDSQLNTSLVGRTSIYEKVPSVLPPRTCDAAGKGKREFISSVKLRPFSPAIGICTNGQFMSRAFLGVESVWTDRVSTFKADFAFHSRRTKKAQRRQEVDELINRLPPRTIRLEFFSEEENDEEFGLAEKRLIEEIKGLKRVGKKLRAKKEKVEIKNSRKKSMDKDQRRKLKTLDILNELKNIEKEIKEKRRDFAVLKEAQKKNIIASDSTANSVLKKLRFN